MPLQNQPILLIDDGSDGFSQELQSALTTAGAEPMVALDEAKALELLKRFEFLAVLVRHPPRYSKHLIDAFGGAPVLLYGAAVGQSETSLPTDAMLILHRLKEILDAQ